jgi:hypothetical protein
MDQAPTRTVSWLGAGRLVVAACLAALASLPALASTEADFERAAVKQKAAEVLCREQYDQVTRSQPTRCLLLRGQVVGLSKTGTESIMMLSLPDEYTVDVQLDPDNPDIQPKSRVRALVSQSGGYGRTRLKLVDFTWDQTPVEVLLEAARNALKIPAPQPRSQVAQQPLPNRGATAFLNCRRWIAYFNPELTATEIETIAGSILGYASQYGFIAEDDVYLIIAVIAAESKFNPNARSYKGAAGLGQLMPATAAAHGVDPYDPVANLDVAIRILRRNLDKYGQDWNLALAAYNAGTGAVQKYGGVPPYRETRTYLWRIYEYWCMMTGRVPEKRS